MDSTTASVSTPVNSNPLVRQAPSEDELVEITQFVEHKKNPSQRGRSGRLILAVVGALTRFVTSLTMGIVFLLFHTRTAIIKFQKWQTIGILYVLEGIILIFLLYARAFKRMGDTFKAKKEQNDNETKVTADNEADLTSIGHMNGVFWSKYSLQTTEGFQKIVVGEEPLFKADDLVSFIKNEFYFWRDSRETKQGLAPQINKIPARPQSPAVSMTPSASLSKNPKHSRMGRFMHRRQRKETKLLPPAWYDDHDILNRTLKEDAEGQILNPAASTTSSFNLNGQRIKRSAFSPATSLELRGSHEAF